ncbi:hypothetical protein Daesc_006790 [Daldinia eschscholtzii]|uniref:Uncharacterized protein n=1 Tax=Daldinia eschscholtzii TaxID=292717 RepID=A0AAX6MI21_9PEZI
MLTRTTRHLAPLRPFAARQSPSSSSHYPTLLQRPWARFSSSSPAGQDPRSPNVSDAQFYKAFGRPMAKVFLLAVFTYQVAYYFWVRLEQDEIRAEMRGTQNPLYLLIFLYVQIHPLGS